MTATMKSRRLAGGPGWHVQDLVCSAGPQDEPFEERHDTVAVAAVVSGTFVYRTEQGSGLLAPGAVLLGNHGRCFACSHEHATGDRCVSFHFAPEYWEEIVAAHLARAHALRLLNVPSPSIRSPQGPRRADAADRPGSSARA